MRNSVRGYGYIRSIRIKQSFIKFTTYSASIIDALFFADKGYNEKPRKRYCEVFEFSARFWVFKVNAIVSLQCLRRGCQKI